MVITYHTRLRTDEMQNRLKGSDRHLMRRLFQNLKEAQSTLARFGPGPGGVDFPDRDTMSFWCY